MINLKEKIEKAVRGSTHLFFVGQAGFVIKSKCGTLLGWDMYLSDCVERLEGHMGFKRLAPKLLSADELCFDGIIASHEHWDHFDYDSLFELTRCADTKLFASFGCSTAAEELGIGEKVTYVEWGDRFDVKDISVRCVSCDHGTAAPDAFGAVITVDGKRIYFAGDTSLHTEYRDEILLDGEIDIMIAPINGAFGNMNEADCATLAEAIKPKLAIPCHYGMFASHGGNPGLFRDIMCERSSVNYLLMAQGEQLII